MNKVIIIALTSVCIAGGGYAQDVSEGQRLARLSFASADLNGNGFLDQGEFREQGENVFVSMDTDENGKLVEAEFLGWGYGIQELADTEARKLAYTTAMRVVFDFWDRDNDGDISLVEAHKSAIFDFQRSDMNNDALLTEDEFINGFPILIAQRIALKPSQP